MYSKPVFHKKELTLASVSEEIENAKKLLITINGKDQEKKAFLEFLDLRIKDFMDALGKTQDNWEKQRILEQYRRFAKTLSNCLSQPKNSKSYIDSYTNNIHYYPVGATKVIEEPVRHNLSLAATIIGAALILASIAAIWINPLITAILLPIGITMLAPGGASLLIPGPLDTSDIKSLEKMIFETGAKIINPELSFEDDQQNTVQYANVF